MASLLGELGCTTLVCSTDLLGFDEKAVAALNPGVLVVEARDQLERGYAALRRLRSLLDTLAEAPALVVVAVSRLGALDFGAADDFVLWPIVPAELYARVRQLDWDTSSFVGEELLKVDDLLIDEAGYETRYRGKVLELTHQEFELLRFLARHRGKVFTREQLLARVWGVDYYGGSRTVDIHVRRLRAKMGDAAELIRTVRNVGYKMAPPGSQRDDDDDDG